MHIKGAPVAIKTEIVILAIVAMVSSSAAYADDVVEVPWNELCIDYKDLVLWAISSRRSFNHEAQDLAGHNLEALGSNAGVCLREFMSDPDPQIRADAARELGYFPGDVAKSVQALRGSLKDPVSLVRAEAAGALAELAPDSGVAVPELLSLLRGTNDIPAGAAAEALAAIGSPVDVIVPALIENLRNRTDNGRVRASWALSELGPRAAVGVPALVEILKSERLRLEGSSFRSDPKTARSSLGDLYHEEHLSLIVSMVLSHVGPGALESGPELRRLLEHRHLYVRVLVAETVWSILQDPQPTIDSTLAILEEASLHEWQTIDLASITLCRLGAAGEPALPRLRAIHESSTDPDVRAVLERALQLVGVERSSNTEDPCVLLGIGP